MKPRLQLGPVLVLLVSLGCHNTMNSLLCNHSTGSKAASPDGRYVAEVFWEDCGATEHATLITTRRTGWLSNQETLFTVENTHRINLSWSDNRTLNVDCGDCDTRDIGQANRNWLDVTVQYKLHSDSGIGRR
jgi:hypothetical protein